MHPNALAYAVLLIWPVVSIVLFRTLGRQRGLLACIISGYLLLPPLPASFDPPVFPPLDKHTIPAFSALTICLVLFLRVSDLVPQGGLARIVLAACFVSPLITITANMDPVFWGSFVVPGMRIEEAIPITLSTLAELTPFLLARALLSGEAGMRNVLWAIVIGTVVYSIPMLIEVRLSPQLNTWIYGFFQHSFDQMMRGGGFRPIVFLYHGLWVAFLTATAVIAALTLLRAAEKPAHVVRLAVAWLLGVLILCKSMASLLYALFALPLVLLFSARMQVRLSLLLAVCALAYPAMRHSGLVPIQFLVDLAASVSVERAGSLQYRFDMETTLLDRAMERPLLGWGSWGRNHVHELHTGRPLTVSDGIWVILIGSVGVVGYVAKLGLLCLPMLIIWWRRTQQISPMAAGAAVILAINMVDLVPNATLTPLTWLLAGALLAWAERPAIVSASRPSMVAGLPVLIGTAPQQPVRTVL